MTFISEFSANQSPEAAKTLYVAPVANSKSRIRDIFKLASTLEVNLVTRNQFGCR